MKMILNLKYFYRKTLRGIHTLRFGFNPKDTWNLDHSFALWVVPRLKYLKKHKHGIPSECIKYPKGYKPWEHTGKNCKYFKAGQKEWNQILTAMIKGFTLKAEEYEDSKSWSKGEPKEYTKAKELFAKWLDSLWD